MFFIVRQVQLVNILGLDTRYAAGLTGLGQFNFAGPAPANSFCGRIRLGKAFSGVSGRTAAEWGREERARDRERRRGHRN